jgi:hypothetical protein
MLQRVKVPPCSGSNKYLTVSIKKCVSPLNCFNVPSFEATGETLCHVHVPYLHGYCVKCETQMCISLPAGLLAGETHYTCHSAWQEELYSVTAMNCGMYGEWAEV